MLFFLFAATPVVNTGTEHAIPQERCTLVDLRRSNPKLIREYYKVTLLLIAPFSQRGLPVLSSMFWLVKHSGRTV